MRLGGEGCHVQISLWRGFRGYCVVIAALDIVASTSGTVFLLYNIGST